jgi:hypothetical protein
MVWVWVVTTAFVVATFITVKLRGYKKMPRALRDAIAADAIFGALLLLRALFRPALVRQIALTGESRQDANATKVAPHIAPAWPNANYASWPFGVMPIITQPARLNGALGT